HPGQLPTPNLRILSSNPGHEHWYWKLESLTPAKGLEKVNRAITHMLGADTSGWDANQILRPPLTFNHKRERPVIVTEWTAGHYSPEEFGELPEPPPPIGIPVPEQIPDINEVI